MPLPPAHYSLPLLAALLLQACASRPGSVFEPPARARPVAIVPLFEGSDDTPAGETRTALADAGQRVQAASKKPGGYRDRDRLLTAAQGAAREGNNPRAQSLARQAGARADTAVEAQRTREAAALLKTLYDTTGLTDAQFGQLRAAEAALVRGENATALRQLQGLNSAVQTPRAYTVQRGDTLSTIAARDGVYGNSLLWPLLWAANRSTLADPHSLRAGATLKIKASPTLEEVVDAIKTARQYPSRVRIGKVKTLGKR